MDADQVENKLKKLAGKNKKLLQSISTHLINNPDELESKLHEHRFLEQKYNQLVGFSRESLDRFQKLQLTLNQKDQEIRRLSRMLADSKDQAVHRIQAMERDNRRRRQRDQIDLGNQQQQTKQLRKAILQKEERCSEYAAELDQYKRICEATTKQMEQCTAQMKIIEDAHRQKVKMLEDKLGNYEKKMKQLQEQNHSLRASLQKKKKLDLIEDIKGMVDSHKRKDNY